MYTVVKNYKDSLSPFIEKSYARPQKKTLQGAAFITDEKGIKILVDLAMSAAGHEAIELQKATCLNTALMGYAPLIFGIKGEDSFEDIMKLCNLVLENLREQPTLPAKLVCCILYDAPKNYI